MKSVLTGLKKLTHIYLLACVVSLCLLGKGYGSDLVVVVNKNSAVEELTKKEVIDIYMGRYVSFPNGEPAKPIDFPANSEIKQRFYQMLVNQDERKIKSYWSRLLFSGRAKPPIETDSSDEVVTLLSTEYSGLAYVERELVTPEMRIVYQFQQQ
ncbi:hypothetical protein [Alteromonas facilis]|uniref:hypothetical protein n=1 Tax=Alteromonas facilis TaxID=2048004 RepID=UPI001F0C567A|nr:hypothetical protein [Alteromonas facilis]